LPKHRILTGAEGLSVLPATGEVEYIFAPLDINITTSTIKPPRKKTRRYHMTWGLFDPTKMRHIRLSDSEHRALFSAMSLVNPDDNIAAFGPTEMAKIMDCTPSFASRQIKTLVERRLLFRIAPNKYRVSPWLYYRGAVADWEKETDGIPEPILDKHVAA